jgi:aminoglycoside phosphotransferase (APT) family kinase protein
MGPSPTRGTTSACPGCGALLHNDLRPDDLLLDPRGRAYLLQWNRVCLGRPWVLGLVSTVWAHKLRPALPGAGDHRRPWMRLWL